jgi:hypothetical protein
MYRLYVLRQVPVLLLAFGGLILISVHAQSASPCDLSPLTKSAHSDTIPWGSTNLDTETVVGLTFSSIGRGIIKIIRTDDTFLFRLNEIVVSQIDSREKDFPKNDCNKYARLTSRDARVTAPNFSVSANVEASAWLCSKVPPYPCKASVDTPRSSVQTMEDESDGDRSSLLTPIQFGGFNIFRPPSPWNPPPNPFHPNKPIINPLPAPQIGPVRMCDTLKTKLGGGSVALTYILGGYVQDNIPKIKVVTKTVNAHLDPQTNFALDLIGGPSVGWIAALQIEKALQTEVSKDVGLDIDEVQLPSEAPEIVPWKTKSAQFDAKPYDGVVTPFVGELRATFTVLREYQTKVRTACYIRDKLKNMH